MHTPSLVRVVEKSTIPFPRLILTDGQIQTLHFQGLRFPGYSADSMYTKVNPTIFTDCRIPGSNEKKRKMGAMLFGIIELLQIIPREDIRTVLCTQVWLLLFFCFASLV